MRRSLTDLRPWRLTTLDEAPITTMLFRNLPLVAPGVDQGTTLTMRFLNDTTQLIVEGPQRQQYVDRTHLAPSTLASRLTLILNTYHHAFLVRDVGILFGETYNRTASFGHDFNELLDAAAVAINAVNWTSACPVFCSRSAVAKLTRWQNVYHCHTVWLVLLFACSAMLLACGVAGILVLSRRKLAPDMLGYVASMTYNNPYLPLPAMGGVLNAAERVRALGNMRVRIADVGRGVPATGALEAEAIIDNVGLIAFTSFSDAKPLRKGQKYM
jgi:hypothetical protein